jgi:hypothetical protein
LAAHRIPGVSHTGSPINQFVEGLFKQGNDRLFALLVGRVDLFAGRQWYLADTNIVAGLYDFASRLSLAEAELTFLISNGSLIEKY